MNKKVMIILGIILGIILIRFCMNAFSQNMMKVMMAKRPAPSVLVGEVGEASVIRKFELPARIEAIYHIDVLARIDGYLTKSYFKEGDYVKKGQVIFEIEPEQYALAVRKAQANVNATRADLVYAEKQLYRAAELVKKDYIAKSSYDETLARRDSLRAQLAMNQSLLADANRNYSYTRVKAPVNGKISLISIPVGNYVTVSSGALTTINSSDPIYVQFSIDTKDYQILVNADGGNAKRKTELLINKIKYPHQGVQDFVDNNVDIETGTVRLRATFDNPDGQLIHGDYASVILYSNSPVKVPVVPQVAVLENPQGKYVYKLDEKGIPQLTTITVAEQNGTNWVVKSGLEVGDKIIVDGLQKVVPGNSVKQVSKEEMDKIKAGENNKDKKQNKKNKDEEED